MAQKLKLGCMGWFLSEEKNEAGLSRFVLKTNLDSLGSFLSQPRLPGFKCQFQPRQPYSEPFLKPTRDFTENLGS